MKDDLKPRTIGVLISTYNNPQWLEKTLWGYMCQTRLPDEVVIADDGSRDDTRELIARMAAEAPFPIRHVWHEDRGFRKNTICNKAIARAGVDYLIVTDQDCVPRKDFVETHLRLAEKGRFLSGGCLRLPMNISEAIDREDVESGRAFSLRWLREQGLRMTFRCSKLFNSPAYAAAMNAITPTKASWNGGTSSAWREDLMAVNGYNEEMHYGGEDRELGERLVNYGLVPRQVRYSAIVIHLDHGRPYKDMKAIEEHKRIRRRTRKEKIVVTPNGIEKK